MPKTGLNRFPKTKGIRLDERTLEAVENLAKKEGKTFSEFVRELLICLRMENNLFVYILMRKGY